jgi:hypothetical protein
MRATVTVPARGRGEFCGTALRTCLTLLIAPFISGCFGNFVPSLKEPPRLYTIDEEIEAVRVAERALEQYPMTIDTRNALITERMYAIDLAYTKYESQVLHESQDIGFLATLTNLGLTGTAALIPAKQTAHILSGIASGVTGAESAYRDKILLNNLVQNLMSQMRTDRNDQAALMLANMQCPVSLYPPGMARSDLEAYYRAGTIPSAVIGLNKTVNKAETDSKANKDSKTPAAPPAAVAQLQMSAAVSDAKSMPAKGCPKIATAG